MPLGTFLIDKDWNKINQDDSSLSGYQSTHEEDQFQTPTPKITKILSDPGQSLQKLKHKNSINDLTDQNVKKLQALNTSQVWLFVPKSNKNDPEEVYQAIKQLKKIKKIIQNTGGWNVLVSNKQQARKLIENGHKKNKLSLRFYVSTKNYDSNLVSVEMKRKRSGSQNKFNEDLRFTSPRKQTNRNSQQQNKKKKLKYLEKKPQKKILDNQIVEEQLESNQKQMKIQAEVIQNLQQIQDPKDVKCIGNQATQLVDKLKQSKKDIGREIQIKLVQKQILTQQNQIQNEQEIQNSKQKQDFNQDNKLQSEIKSQEIDIPLEQQYDSQQDLQKMKRALKRKNKKLNKKKTTVSQQNYIDQNNPFSLLSK